MSQTLILYPLFAMVLFSCAVGIILLKLRVRAVANKELKVSYFELNRGGTAPDYLARATELYNNVYETPVLFYAAILLMFSLKQVDVIYIALAWAYIVSRLVHACILLGYNNVLHRRNAFLVSFLVLVIIWIRLFIHVIAL